MKSSAVEIIDLESDEEEDSINSGQRMLEEATGTVRFNKSSRDFATEQEEAPVKEEGIQGGNGDLLKKQTLVEDEIDYSKGLENDVERWIQVKIEDPKLKLKLEIQDTYLEDPMMTDVDLSESQNQPIATGLSSPVSAEHQSQPKSQSTLQAKNEPVSSMIDEGDQIEETPLLSSVVTSGNY